MRGFSIGHRASVDGALYVDNQDWEDPRRSDCQADAGNAGSVVGVVERPVGGDDSRIWAGYVTVLHEIGWSYMC